MTRPARAQLHAQEVHTEERGKEPEFKGLDPSDMPGPQGEKGTGEEAVPERAGTTSPRPSGIPHARTATRETV